MRHAFLRKASPAAKVHQVLLVVPEPQASKAPLVQPAVQATRAVPVQQVAQVYAAKPDQQVYKDLMAATASPAHPVALAPKVCGVDKAATVPMAEPVRTALTGFPASTALQACQVHAVWLALTCQLRT